MLERRRSSALRELSRDLSITGSHRRLWHTHRQAQYYLLQYQFKRVHKLTNVKSFNFLDYLSRALRGHIIHIIEPSHKTSARPRTQTLTHALTASLAQPLALPTPSLSPLTPS